MSLSVVTLTNIEGKTGVEVTYPPTVDGHVSLLGVSLGLSPTAFRDQILKKGFKNEWSDDNNINLTGQFYGKASRLTISIGYVNGKPGCLYSVRVSDLKTLRLPQAKAHFNQLVQKMEATYGKGKREPSSDQGYAKHTIPVGKGFVTVEMMNEDEMEGASDFYLVLVYLQDFKD